MTHKKYFLTAMLDEIERLRGVLCLEHSSACTILRAGAACTCGAAARTTSMLSETHLLRAQLIQARALVECAQREIMRMDRRLLETSTGRVSLARGSAVHMVAMLDEADDGAVADSDAA